MSFGRCKNCGEYDLLKDHKCRPQWEAIAVDYDDEDDPQKAFGYSAESAAIHFAEQNFSNWEYPEELEAWIRKPGDEEWQKFNVEVEMVPSFTVMKKVNTN